MNKKGWDFEPIEVDVSLVPGHPQVHIMGLPDTSIKESQVRIKTALRSQGFDFPTNKMVLVDLKPSYLKKKSQGMDLAIAVAFLIKTGQLQWPFSLDQVYIYGELSLSGHVFCTKDLYGYVPFLEEGGILTGVGGEQTRCAFDLFQVKELRDLKTPEKLLGNSLESFFKKPQNPEFSFSKEQSEVAQVIACGEHQSLLAGPAGGGKTTLSRVIYSLMTSPNEKQMKSILYFNRHFQSDKLWRPYVAPHHTIPLHSMVGGGDPPLPGEVTRANEGLLLLDELLEFKRPVLESLREPIESGWIQVSRLTQRNCFPARFLLLATTNLCPCGKYVPKENVYCQRSLTRCRSYLQKLSGPLLDRFQILFFLKKQNSRSVSFRKMKENVQKGVEFRIKERKQILPNVSLNQSQLIERVESDVKKHLMPEFGLSRRREKAVLSVARTLADLDQDILIQEQHLHKAMAWTYFSFKTLSDEF